MKQLADADIALLLPLLTAHPGKVLVLDGDDRADLHSADDAVILVKKNADVIINEKSSRNTYIIVEENARLRYNSTSGGNVLRAIYLKADSQLLWHDIGLEGTKAHNSVHLVGPGANAKFASIMLARNGTVAQATNMIHEASRTSSSMLTRAVLLDGAQGTYRGLIKVLPKAKGCSAHQKEDTLLLGDNARMDAVPVLEISNNDVQCSHGVTLGQVDEEQLFYMESRSIPHDAAVTMLVQGFFDQLLISMGQYGNEVREELMQRVQHA